MRNQVGENRFLTCLIVFIDRINIFLLSYLNKYFFLYKLCLESVPLNWDFEMARFEFLGWKWHVNLLSGAGLIYFAIISTRASHICEHRLNNKNSSSNFTLFAHWWFMNMSCRTWDFFFIGIKVKTIHAIYKYIVSPLDSHT